MSALALGEHFTIAFSPKFKLTTIAFSPKFKLTT